MEIFAKLNHKVPVSHTLAILLVTTITVVLVTNTRTPAMPPAQESSQQSSLCAPSHSAANKYEIVNQSALGLEAITCNCDCDSYCNKVSGNSSDVHKSSGESTNTKFTVQNAISEVRDFATRNQLQKLVTKSGAQKIFILTSWRSGSSFFGEALSSHPAIYYHYEPLMYFEYKEVSSGEELETAFHTLETLSNCDYAKAEKYMTKIRNAWNLLFRNSKVNSQCRRLKHDCFDYSFLHESCKLFPIQLFKLTRIRGKGAEEIIRRFPDAKIIYLVRDPLAIYSSRMQVGWCPAETACGNITLLCADLEADLAEIRVLQSKHAEKVQVIKYEHVALKPKKNFLRIFKSMGLEWHGDVQKYLDSHTTANKDDPMSTIKVSSAHVDQWKHFLAKETVHQVQEQCRQFMLTLNYKFMEEEEGSYGV